MERFTVLTSVAVPLPQDDIDTDIIFPARFLLITDRVGLGRFGFYDWRFEAHGKERPGFPFAQARWRGASIIVTGANFGCGSSREHAPWALHDMGIRCVIAPSFGDIFYNNCFRNGILPIVTGPEEHALLTVDAEAGRVLTIDLSALRICRADATEIAFAVDARRRDALFNGWDEIDQIVGSFDAAITAFEASQQRLQPWLWSDERQQG